MSGELPRVFQAENLAAFAAGIFAHFGVPEVEAQMAADVLVRADLRGIDSHGVARLGTYGEMLEAGRINPRPAIRIVRETPATATVDGDNGLGLVVGPRANAIAMDKAEAVGSGWVAVRNSNHFGIAGYYPLQALARDLIGYAMTNSTTIVAPLWASDKLLGTNPIAIAFPAATEPPIVIDMATSAVAFGKVEIAIRKGEPLLPGWATDRDGLATTDPAAMIAGGALMPLGGDREHGGHKGYCLAAMVDILSCLLSGASWGPFAPPFALRQAGPERSPGVGQGIGHFFGAWRIDAFIEPAEFRREVDAWIKVFRGARPAPGHDGPLIPGDPEREAEAIRARHGIPLLPTVVAELCELSSRTGVPLE